MEKYKNLKKGTRVGLVITAVLLVLALINAAVAIGMLLRTGNNATAINVVLDIVMCVLIGLYSLFGYKKPHGDMLKHIFFAFAVYLALHGTLDIARRNFYGDFAILAGLVIAYVAGRLNKIDNNKRILTFVGLLLLTKVVILIIPFNPVLRIWGCLGLFTEVIIHAALSFAYIARYEEHKAAGLEDK